MVSGQLKLSDTSEINCTVTLEQLSASSVITEVSGIGMSLIQVNKISAGGVAVGAMLSMTLIFCITSI